MIKYYDQLTKYWLIQKLVVVIYQSMNNFKQISNKLKKNFTQWDMLKAKKTRY